MPIIGFILPAEKLKMTEIPLAYFLSKPRYNAASILKFYGLFNYEDKYFIPPPHGATAPPVGQGPSHYRDFMITLKRTTFSKTSLEE